MTFVDTNYFLRFFLNDIKEQRLKVNDLFIASSEGKIKLFTSVIVFFEISWVLKSTYKKSKEEITTVLTKLLDLQFIELENRDVLEQSLRLFKVTNFALEDCFNINYAKYFGAKEFKTFDQKLNKEFLR